MPDASVVYSARPDTDSGPSQNIWGNCNWAELAAHPDQGIVFEDDFVGTLLANNIAETNAGKWRAYSGATAGSDIINGSTTEVGGFVLVESTTDNEGVGLRSLPLFKIAQGQGKFWFECRLKQVNITDSKFSIFVGLFEEATFEDDVPIDKDTDAMSDNNFVGFQRVFADGDKLDSTYKANGVTQVTVGTDAVEVVADTYVKIGMYFDGAKLFFYKNGEKLADSKTIPSAAGTDFPNDVNLGVAIALMLGHGDTASLTLDWIRAAQERVA